MTEQLNASLCATHLQFPVLRASMLMDIEQLHNNILSALLSDPIAQIHLSDTSHPHWSIDTTGLLRLDGRIFVPEADDLRLRVLRFKHDHPLSGHYGQSRTLDLVQREYTWPGVCTYVKDYVKSCTACARAKCHDRFLPVGHWFEGSLRVDEAASHRGYRGCTATRRRGEWTRECPTHGKVPRKVREVFSTGFGLEVSELSFTRKC